MEQCCVCDCPGTWPCIPGTHMGDDSQFETRFAHGSRCKLSMCFDARIVVGAARRPRPRASALALERTRSGRGLTRQVSRRKPLTED